jgi:hypothetical protein
VKINRNSRNLNAMMFWTEREKFNDEFKDEFDDEFEVELRKSLLI